MAMPRININRGALKQLYLTKNLSPNKIGKIFNCSFSTITNRLKEYGIPLKSPAFARMRYQKFNFDDNLIDKAYMIGFRLGDLHVRRPSPDSETIVVQCHTTQKYQVDVIKSLFKKFGKVNASFNPKGNHFYVNCYLNNSFGFLFSKNENTWAWVKDKSLLSLAFIAGYTDAEGNFILNQNRGRFKIDSYDFSILSWISSWLRSQDIPNKFRLIYKMGDKWNGRYPLNKDLWRLNINKANALYKFIESITPYLRHKQRINDARICLRNINNRIKNGTIKHT